MTIVLRATKGTPLTADEMDGNFKEIVKRLEMLEGAETIPEDFIHIKQEGDEVIFTSNRGAEWGRVQLPTVIMTPRGLWQKDTYYGKNDIVGTDKAAYICLKSHMSHDFYREHDHWLTLFTFPSSTTTAIPLESFKLPTMTQDSMLSPIFGMLALYVDEQRPQLLIGDMENWRRVSDNHIVNPDQES